MILRSFQQENVAPRTSPFLLMGIIFLFTLLITYQFISDEENALTKPSMKLVEKESSGPTFLFVMGIEGTGHHLFLSLFQKYLKSGNGLSEEFFEKYALHEKFYFQPKKEPGFWSAPCAQKPSNGTALFEDVVDNMKIIDFEIRSQGLEHAAVVPINAGFDHFMNSYPSKHRDCRALQYPDIDMTYAACEKAGVKCKHVVLSRDPYEIIRSTTMKREFDPKHRQIKLMATMLDVINTQIVSYPDQLHACWGYNKGAEDILNIGELLGWEAADFTNIYSDLFRKPTPLTDEDRTEIVPPELQPFMETMINSMERIEATCESILSSQS